MNQKTIVPTVGSIFLMGFIILMSIAFLLTLVKQIIKLYRESPLSDAEARQFNWIRISNRA